MIFNEAFTEQTHHLFEKIQDLDVNDESSQKKILLSVFNEKFKATPLKSALLSFFTLGLHAFRLKRECENHILSALAARKFMYLHDLKQLTEEARTQSHFQDPKVDINKIYKKVIQTERPVFRNIYTKYDLYLLITIPFEEEKISDFFLKKSKKRQTLDFVHSWNVLKKRLKMEEVKNIQCMNHHYSVLKNRYLLTKKEIHSRLKRTSIGHQSPQKLTTLPYLCEAFDEIIHAFEAFKTLRQSRPEIFRLLSLLLNLPAHFYERLNPSASSEIQPLSEDLQDFLQEMEHKKETLQTLYMDQHLRPLLLILSDMQVKLIEYLCQKVPATADYTSLEETQI